jgi:putative transposase
MPRTARIVAKGYPHHVTQRGNFRQQVFDSDFDKAQYLEFVAGYTTQYGVEVLAYCLMSNHIHFIVIPEEVDSISKAFNRAHFRYSQYYNKKKNQKGHLWQGRFYSCVIDTDEYLQWAIRYVERNPVRAKMVKKAWGWKWSSAGVHTGNAPAGLKVEKIEKYTGTKEKDWKKFIEEEDSEEFAGKIRKITTTGRGLGGEAFMKSMEKKLKVTLRILRPGRKGAQ